MAGATNYQFEDKHGQHHHVRITSAKKGWNVRFVELEKMEHVQRRAICSREPNVIINQAWWQLKS